MSYTTNVAIVEECLSILSFCQKIDSEEFNRFLDRWIQFAINEGLYGGGDNLSTRKKELMSAFERFKPFFIDENINDMRLSLAFFVMVIYNQKRTPNSVSELYAHSVSWLTNKKDRELLRDLGFFIQFSPPYFHVDVADKYEELTNILGDNFLKIIKDDLRSVIIVQNGRVYFRYIALQEYLAAECLAGRPDEYVYQKVFTMIKSRSEIKFILFLSGVLFHQGPRKLTLLLEAILDYVVKFSNYGPGDKKYVFSLIGSIITFNPGYQMPQLLKDRLSDLIKS